ncbi:unnamed protein product [Lathyrus oleraceus]
MEGLIPFIIGAISRKQHYNQQHVIKHSDSSKRLLLGSSSPSNSFNGSFRRRTRGSGSDHFHPLVSEFFLEQPKVAPLVTANNNQLRNRKH